MDIRGYKPNEGVHLGQLKKAVKLLKVARRPIILAGGGIKIAGAEKLLEQLVNTTHVPVVTTVMGKGAIDSNKMCIRDRLCFEWKDKDRCISDEGTDLYRIVYCAGNRTDPAAGIYVWSRKG